MPSRSPVRILLPAAQALVEGSWLAVLYAALQAAAGDVAHFGPIELGALALAGLAWGRRRRWRSPTAEALGLPLLALAAGLFGWLLDPGVRGSLVDGEVIPAFGLHVPGWLAAALAFWRGETHRVRADDAVTQEWLTRWAVPALAVPWLIGYASASGRLEGEFAAAAFVSTIVFSGSAFTALGLARLEAARLAIGSDWRDNRSWLSMIVGLALVLTAVSVPTAALLRIPTGGLLATLLGPLQTLLLIIITVTAPIFLLAAVVADWLAGLLPEGFRLGRLTFPTLDLSGEAPGSDLPAIILSLLVAGIFASELLLFVVLLWMRYTNRRRREEPDPEFEERSIVLPTSNAAKAATAPATHARRPLAADDPTGAYLAALDALAADGRWPRRQHETPAAHLGRVRAEGLITASFGRLTAAYQLARYSPRPLPDHERRRARARLQALRGWLQRG